MCMQKKVDECPESDYVMKKLGLEISVLEKGLELLCERQEGT